MATCAARLATRLAWAIIAGSRILSWASSGVAMKIEEYVPAAMPTNSASARSFRGPEPSWNVPTYRIAPTGSRAAIDVLIDRTRVWLTARLAASA